jgi:hypothetical protein
MRKTLKLSHYATIRHVIFFKNLTQNEGITKMAKDEFYKFIRRDSK